MDKIKELTDLAFSLCQIPSLTYQEQEVLQFLLEWAQRRQLYCEKIPVDQDRYNLLIAVQKKAFYKAILCTHIDTVPPFIAPSVKEGILWGRGSCDAKGIAAAMLIALESLRSDGHDDAAVLLTVGEEEASDGAKACLPALKARAATVIVGEPTSLRAASAQKGSLVFDLVTEGVEAHSSMPERGDSASHELICVLNNLLNQSWPNNQEFGETLLNIGTITAGKARNMLAGDARAQCIMRLSAPAKECVEKISKHLGANTKLIVKSQTDPFYYTVPNNVATFIAGFGSDAPYLRDIGNMMLIGPGELEVAHQNDEHVAIKDLYEGFQVYKNLVLF